MRSVWFGLLSCAIAVGVAFVLASSDEATPGGNTRVAQESSTPAPGLRGVGAEAADSAAGEPPGEEHRRALGVTPPGERPTGLLLRMQLVDPAARVLPAASGEVRADGVVVDRQQSGADGRIELRLPAFNSVARAVHVHLSKGRLHAYRRVWIHTVGEKPLDLGTVVLEPGNDLRVRATIDGVAAANARVAVRVKVDGLEVMPPSMAQTDAEGRTRFAGLPKGLVTVYGHAEGRGRGVVTSELPRDEELELVIPANRVVTVRVVQAEDKAPIPGAEVFITDVHSPPWPNGRTLPPMPVVRTGADGTVEVPGCPSGHLRVRATAEGRALPSNGIDFEDVRLPPEGREATLALHVPRTVRLPIQESESGGPPTVGAVVRVERSQPMAGLQAAEIRGRIEEGFLVLEGVRPGFDVGRVTTSEGYWADWQAMPSGGKAKPVVFRRLKDLEIRMRWSDGEPIANTSFQIGTSFRAERRDVVSDASGHIEVEGLAVASAWLTWRRQLIKRFDLTSPSAPFEVELQRPRRVELSLRVHGKPHVPADVRISVPPPMAQIGARLHPVSDTAIQLDRESGRILFDWLPATADEVLRIQAQASDLPAVTITADRDEDGVYRATIDLVSTTQVRLRVQRPEGLSYRVGVEQWDEQRSRWSYAHQQKAVKAGLQGREGVHTFEGLLPGRYRIKEMSSGWQSEPIDVRAGGDPVEVQLDLRSFRTVKGQLHAPEGMLANMPALYVARLDGDSKPSRVPLYRTGAFKLTAQQGERLRFTLEHPQLTLLAPETVYRVGESPIELRAGMGPVARFRLAPGTLDPLPTRVRILLLRAGESMAKGTPASLQAKGGVFECHAPEPGRYDLLIQVRSHVPRWLRGIEFQAEGVDLGTLAFERGTKVELHLEARTGSLPPGLIVSATRQGLPSYHQSMSVRPSGPKAQGVLDGIGQGRFTLTIRSLGRGTKQELEFESDGKTPIKLDVLID